LYCADNDHSEDEFAHRHAVGTTTFGLQEVLFGVGSETIGGFKEGGLGGFTAHGDGLDGGSEVRRWLQSWFTMILLI
jgi:hypothetical protein